MGQLFRFNDYDFWAYLSSGVLAIAAWDFAFGTSWILKEIWGVTDAVIIVFAAYVLGHVVAAPASWLLERVLVAKVLRSPSDNLFVDEQSGYRRLLKRWLLADYYQPLDPELRKRVLAQAGDNPKIGESLFWKAFAIAKRDSNAYSRMSNFLNVYGFCRNISFVCFVFVTFNLASFAGIGVPGARLPEPTELAQWSILSIVVGFLLLHRFLKFYRLYSVEVFVAYAESREASGAD